jgi:hypothetical protein
MSMWWCSYSAYLRALGLLERNRFIETGEVTKVEKCPLLPVLVDYQVSQVVVVVFVTCLACSWTTK